MALRYPEGMLEAKEAIGFGNYWDDSNEDTLVSYAKGWTHIGEEFSEALNRVQKPINDVEQKNVGKEFDAFVDFVYRTRDHDSDLKDAAVAVAIGLATTGKALAGYKKSIIDVLHHVDDYVGSKHQWWDPRDWGREDYTSPFEKVPSEAIEQLDTLRTGFELTLNSAGKLIRAAGQVFDKKQAAINKDIAKLPA